MAPRLIRDAGELLARLTDDRRLLREYRRQVWDDLRSALDCISRDWKTAKIYIENAQRILDDMADVDQQIDQLISETLRPMLQRREARERKEAALTDAALLDMLRRIAELEQRVEELARPKNVVDLKQRKEGNAK